ncbi:MAG: ribosome assembly RNA-binding protein YhbY [Oscillospiraceae bacterium]
MITTKQRAMLRSMANGMETILQVGKGGITDATVTQVEDALTARELIKLRVLETSPITSREVAQQLAERCRADIVQVIGTRFVLFRRNHEKPKIELK